MLKIETLWWKRVEDNLVSVWGDWATYEVDWLDDHMQIQQAIDAVSLSGWWVIKLRSITYSIWWKIELKDWVSLVWEWVPTKLVLQNWVDEHVISIPWWSRDITVKDIYIDWNSSGQTALVSGIVVEKSPIADNLRVNDNIKIDSVYVYDCKNMWIILIWCNSWVVTNCTTELWDFGIWSSNSDWNLIMWNCVLNANLHRLVVAHTCKNTKVIWNTIQDTMALATNGSAIELTYWSMRTICSWNVILNTSWLGIFARWSRGNIITDNVVDWCWSHWISVAPRTWFWDSHRQLISWNIVTGSQRGISISETGNSVTGNRIFENREQGIKLTTGSNTVITWNIIFDNGTSAAWTFSWVEFVSSNSCTIKNNVIKNQDLVTQNYAIEKDTSVIIEWDNQMNWITADKNF